MYFWDELQGVTRFSLAARLRNADSSLVLNVAGTAGAGDMIQVDAEVMSVTAVDSMQYTVTRGMHGTQAVAHDAAAAVYHLAAKTAIAPFAPNFFGSPYSGSWNYATVMPDVCIASAQLFVTNRKGDSPPATIALTHSAENGMRTYAGGQYALQVDGYLAIEDSATPPVVIDSKRSVRDVYGVLGTAADAPVTFQVNVNGAAFCECTFQPGLTVSSVVNGLTLPPLEQRAQITLSILAVGQTYPGADLTVVVRL